MAKAVWFLASEAAPLSASARVVLLCVIGLLLVMLGFLTAMALIIRRRPSPAAEPPATRELWVCPTCRHPYEPGLVFCPADARRLIPASTFDAKATGGVCSACRRGFEAGLRFCPHDASELVPAAVFEATRNDESTMPTGVIAKICPQCRRRHDLSAVFCGKDGVELVAIN